MNHNLNLLEVASLVLFSRPTSSFHLQLHQLKLCAHLIWSLHEITAAFINTTLCVGKDGFSLHMLALDGRSTWSTLIRPRCEPLCDVWKHRHLLYFCTHLFWVILTPTVSGQTQYYCSTCIYLTLKSLISFRYGWNDVMKTFYFTNCSVLPEHERYLVTK